jgi:hypothetical protein
LRKSFVLYIEKYASGGHCPNLKIRLIVLIKVFSV